MKHWYKDAPPWLGEVFEGMREEPAPLRWLSEKKSKEAAKALEERFAKDEGPGYALSPAVRAMCAERAAQAVPVASGPQRSTRLQPIQHEVQVYLDPARPEQLWAGLGDDFPPLLWIPLGTTRASVEAALAPYTDADMPLRRSLAGIARGFAGTAQEMGVSEAREIENHFVFVPCVDMPTWGSEYEDDPWPAEMPAGGGVNMLAQISLQRQYMAQRPGRVPSTSWRTLWSRSILTLEEHPSEFFTFEVRYRPSSHPEVMREVNRRFEAQYPEDLPADVMAALLGFRFRTASEMEGKLRDPKEAANSRYFLLGLATVRHAELGFQAILREFAESEDLERRTTAAIAADWLDYTLLLHEMCAAETDPELREQLEERTAFTEPQDEEDEEDLDEDDEDLDDEDDDLDGEDDDDLDGEEDDEELDGEDGEDDDLDDEGEDGEEEEET